MSYPPDVATQLREYRIVEGALAQFVDEWQRHLAPLRRRLGFVIDGAWTVPGKSRFVWLLSHPGGWEAFEESDRRYFASPERNALDPDPARLIEKQVTWRLEPAERD
jgi:hypothetical protein